MKIKIEDMILSAMFAALICVGAFIRIPVPVMPFTLQVLFVILAGLICGKTGGGFSALIYLLLGLSGLPIFTQGGGISYLLKPSFGFIIGFVFGAFVAGAIANKVKNPGYGRIYAAAAAGVAVIYACGIPYFYIINNVVLGIPMTVKATLYSCFLLVIPGDIISCVFAGLLAKRLIPLRQKRRME